MKVSIEFVGGVLDGKTLSNASPDAHESRRAASYYIMCEQGRVGARFKTAWEAKPDEARSFVMPPIRARGAHPSPNYEVTGRQEKDGAVWVRATYLGREP